MARIRQAREPGGVSPALRIRWQPQDFSLRAGAEEVLRGSVQELGLADVLRDIHVSVDLANRDDHAYIEWNSHDHGTARLWFALGNFVTPARRRAWKHVWSRRPGVPPLQPRQFSARSFAEAVLRVYDDESLWQRLSTGGRLNIERFFSRDVARTALRGLLGTP